MLFLATALVTVLAVGKIREVVEEDPSFFSHPAQTQGHVVAAGMPPQIELMREIASQHGWEVTCEGTSGKMTALGFSPTFWTWMNVRDAFYQEVAIVSTSSSTSESISKSAPDCGLDIGLKNGSSGVSVTASIEKMSTTPLALGTREELAPYIEMANSCGLAAAHIAPLTPEDREMVLLNFYDEIPDDWQAVYSGQTSADDMAAWHCFGIMTHRYEKDNPV